MFTNSIRPVHGLLYAVVLILSLGSAPTFAASDESDSSEPFAAVNELIYGKKWDQAVTMLESMVKETPDDANVHNLLGYTYRNQQKYDVALVHYTRALELDPEHKGALEYVGELYLETDRLELAEQMLERLDKVCGFFCKEKSELKSAIKKYKAAQ